MGSRSTSTAANVGATAGASVGRWDGVIRVMPPFSRDDFKIPQKPPQRPPVRDENPFAGRVL